MRIYELTPVGYDRAKSFYGKAKVIETDGETLLQSYDTIVCKIDKSGEFVRMWDVLPVEEKPHSGADMTPAESLKAMYARRAANY